jgi:hypothetical protein
MPVDLLGDGRAGVAAEIGDVLDGHAVVTHDAHERVTEFSGSPRLPDACLLGDEPERAPYVGGVERRSDG